MSNTSTKLGYGVEHFDQSWIWHRTLRPILDMASNTSTKPVGAKTRVSWTVEMLKDLVECRDKAKNLHQGGNAPRKPNGRKVGYVDIMLKFWNEKGYSELNLTKQNNATDSVMQKSLQCYKNKYEKLLSKR